jgi:hypothetical protein
MNLVGSALALFLVSTLAVTFVLVARLKFFSKKARDLAEVNPDFQELRIEDFADLVCPEADEYINREWPLSRRARREACANRIRIVRDWLRRILMNGALCLEVARFHIRKIEETTGEPLGERDHLAVRIFDRGAMCHFIATVCLVRLFWIEFCMIAWPLYLPHLAGRFDVRGHSLVAWYGHLVEDVLELASEHEKQNMYEHVLFMLTGLIEMPESTLRRWKLLPGD